MSESKPVSSKGMNTTEKIFFWLMIFAIVSLAPEIYQIINPSPVERGYAKLIVIKGDKLDVNSDTDTDTISYCTKHNNTQTRDEIIPIAIATTKKYHPDFALKSISVSYCATSLGRTRLND